MELVPIPAVLSAPYSGVQLSEEAARAPGRGLQSAGRSIMEVGGQIEEFGQRMQAARDEANLIKAKMIQEQGEAEMDEFMARTADEATWSPKASEIATKVNSKIAELKMSKTAQSAFQEQQLMFNQRFHTKVKHAATLKEVKVLELTFTSRAKQLAEAGRLEEADDELNKGVRVGVISSSAAILEQQSNGRIATVANVKRMMGKDAASADATAKMLFETDKDGKYVNYPDTLSQDDRTALRNSAEYTAAHFREKRGQEYQKRIYEAKESNDLAEMLRIGAELDGDVKTGGLLAIQVNNIKRLLTDTWDPKEVQIRSVAIMEDIRRLNPGNQTEWNSGVLFARMRANGLPDGAVKTIEEAIDRQQKIASTGATKLPAGVSAEEKLTRVRDSDGFGPYVGLSKPQYEVEMQDVKEWRLSGRLLWMPYPKKEVVGQKPVLTDKGLPQFVRNADTGEPIIDPKKMAKQAAKREKAEAAHAEAQLALQAWRKQNPKSSEADALKWVDDYLAARQKENLFETPINQADAF